MSSTEMKLTESKETWDHSVASVESYQSGSKQLGFWNELKDSFKRHPDHYENEPSGNKMQKYLSKRHLRLMALSTGLGTGLLVASGSRLNEAGPLFLLLGYGLVGIFMLMPCINAAGELSVAYNSLPGGFQSFYKKFLDESAAFAIGWNYYFQWANIISLELVTASMVIKFWTTKVDPDVFVAIFLLAVIAINFAGAKGYGEAEFAMNCIKLLMLTGFIIFGIVMDAGGGPPGFIGARYWRNPGAYTNFKGLCSVFATSAFSLGGTEFISLSASEQKNPRQAIPAACKLVLFRIIVLFLGSLTVIGLLVPYNSPKLMGSGSAEVHSSPFVIAAEMHGVKVLPHFINAVILISTVSVASAAMYSSPRLLQSLAEQGYAPKYFDYIDRKGRPLRSWIVTILLSCFSFIATFKDQEAVFDWLLSVSALSFIFVWAGIDLCHIRFRRALAHNNVPLTSLGYTSSTGVVGSYVSLILTVLILVAQFWIGIFPSNGSDSFDVSAFLKNVLGMVFLFMFYLGHKIYTGNWKLYIKVEDIDIDADRTVFDEGVLKCEEEEKREKLKQAPIWTRIWMICFS